MTTTAEGNLPADPRCAWHEHASPLDGDEPWNIACDCGTLLQTKDCEGCARVFLDWRAKGYDDIMSAPSSTGDGDLVCIPCARDWEKNEREQEEYDETRDGDWNGYYP